MTDDRMALLELVEQHADGDFLRELGQFALQRLMEIEADARCGASKLEVRARHELPYRVEVHACHNEPTGERMTQVVEPEAGYARSLHEGLETLFDVGQGPAF